MLLLILLKPERLIKAEPYQIFDLAQFKLVISDNKGKTIPQDLKDRAAQPLLGSKIGDSIDSSVIGIAGGSIRISGGSDKSGTPMRKDIHGGVKKYVLLSRGVGMRSIKEGERKRKLVRGNMITEEIYQINCVLIGSSLPSKKTVPAESEEKEANKQQK